MYMKTENIKIPTDSKYCSCNNIILTILKLHWYEHMHNYFTNKNKKFN